MNNIADDLSNAYSDGLRKEEQEPWLGDDLDCPNCGAMLELLEGGMLACRLCGFAYNDTAEVEG